MHVNIYKYKVQLNTWTCSGAVGYAEGTCCTVSMFMLYTWHVTRGPLLVDNMMVTRLTRAWCPVLSLVVICIRTAGYCSQVRRYVHIHMPISVYKQNMFLKIFENNLSIQNIIHKNLVPRHRLNLWKVSPFQHFSDFFLIWKEVIRDLDRICERCVSPCRYEIDID